MNMLDIRTVLFSSIITSAMCAIVMASLWRQNHRRWPELKYWLADFVLQFLSILLIALRGVIPDVLSVLPGVPLSLAGALLMLFGLEQFVGQPRARRYNFGLLAVFTVVHVYFIYGQPNLPVRNINFSLGLLVFCGQCAWLMLRRVDASLRAETKAVGVMFGLYSLVSVLRILADLIAPRTDDLFTSGLYDTLAILIYQLLLIGLTFAAFLMVNRRLFTALENDLSARRQAEEALRKTEARYQKLIDTSIDGFCVLDRTGQLLEVNDAYCAMTGYARDTLLTLRISDLESAETQAQSQAHMQQIIARGGDRFESQHRCADGRLIDVEVSTVYHADQQVFLVFTNNITGRKQAEQQIESLARFPGENPNPVLRLRPDGTILYANPASRAILQEWGCAVGQIAPPVWQSAVAAAYTRQASTWLDVQATGRNWSFFLTPIVEAGYINLYGRDITDSKQVEAQKAAVLAELRASEESLNLAIAAGRMGTWDRNFLTGQLQWSVECKAMFGLAPETEMNDERFIQTLHPDDRAPIDQAIRHSLGQQTDFQAEYRVVWPDGTLHWITAQGRGYFDTTGQTTHMAGITFDITSRKQAEEALRISEERFHLAMEAANSGAWEWDLRTNENIWSDELWKVYGLEPHSYEPSYETWLQTIHPDDRAQAVQAVQSAARDGTELNAEWRVCDQTGAERWLMSRGRPVRDASGQVVRMIGIVLDITDRKQADEALRESEERFRSLYENSSVGIYRTTPDGRILLANPALVAMLGYSSFDELAARNLEQIGFEPAYQRAQFVETIERSGQIKGLESSWTRRDGTAIFVRESARAIRDLQGRTLYYDGTVEDITERKQAEEALQHSHNMIVKLTAQVPGVVYQYRLYPDGRSAFPFASPGMNDIYEVTPEDVREDATPVFGRLHPDDYDRIVASIQESARTLQPFHGEFRVILPRQGLRWRLSDALPETMEDGGTLWHGIISDITERKQAEDDIRKLNAELEQRVAERTAELSDLYNNAPCGYHSLDANGVFVRVNDTELHWLGYTREEVIGKMAAIDLFTPASVEIFQHNFPIFKARGWLQDLELDMVRKDGSILSILLNATVITDREGRYLMSRSTMIDHTDRKRAESEREAAFEAMRAAQIQLEAANKELEAFSYSVSHDLRAPLRGIDGWSLALLEDYGLQLDPLARQYLDRVRGETQRMGGLIDDLLQLSRVTRADLQPTAVDVSALAATITARLQSAQPARQFEFSIQPDLIAQGDAHLLEIALTNLLDNAVKFSGTRPVARIEFGQTEVAGKSAYFVRDNGVGFDPTYARNLFGAFQRMHRAAEFPGTGIGLATVQRIIHRHGGRVWAEAAVDLGATFYFTLEATA